MLKAYSKVQYLEINRRRIFDEISGILNVVNKLSTEKKLAVAQLSRLVDCSPKKMFAFYFYLNFVVV